MPRRSRHDSALKPVVIIVNPLLAVIASACMFIRVVRVPALSATKVEDLFGTLPGTAMAMLFVIAALLVDSTYMVYRANRLGGGGADRA